MAAILRAFTEEQREELARRYRAGATMQDLADASGRSTTAVRNALLAQGVKLRRVGWRKPKGGTT